MAAGYGRHGLSHPDMWSGVLVRDLRTLERRLRDSLLDPLGGADRYSCRELREFADLIHDRFKRCPSIGKVDEIGIQEEVINLYYSNYRLTALGISPQILAARLQRRNINLPAAASRLHPKHRRASDR